MSPTPTHQPLRYEPDRVSTGSWAVATTHLKSTQAAERVLIDCGNAVDAGAGSSGRPDGRLSRIRTPLGSELAIGLGAAATAVVFAGVNSPAMLMFGPVADRLGATVQLHPFRRANVMDCFTLAIGAVVPVRIVFLLISSQLAQGYEVVTGVSAVSIFTAAFYPLALTVVMLVAVLTGWGRRFEGAAGAELREPPA